METEPYSGTKSHSISKNHIQTSKIKKSKKERKRRHSSSSDHTENRHSKSMRKKKCKKRHKHNKEKSKKREKDNDMNKEKNKPCKKNKNDDVLVGPEIPEVLDKSKSMAPMSKEEWEKRQNVTRRVFYEDTGRTRLIKGDGEVIEEIVSRERHNDINRQATIADGNFFQSKLKLWLKK